MIVGRRHRRSFGFFWRPARRTRGNVRSRDDDEVLPDALDRAMRIPIVVLIVVWVCGFALRIAWRVGLFDDVALPLPSALLDEVGLLLVFVMLGTMASITIVLKVQKRRWRRKILTLNYEACLRCAYPLRGLPPKHVCPECGEPYDIQDVRRSWVRAFKEQPSRER